MNSSPFLSSVTRRTTSKNRNRTFCYEAEHYTIPSSDAVSIVRFLIEHKNLTQRDLIPEFGSESAVSMFLSGQRKLTLDQVRRLSTRFHLSSDVFIQSSR